MLTTFDRPTMRAAAIFAPPADPRHKTRTAAAVPSPLRATTYRQAVFNEEERTKLDRLMAAALLDEQLQRRLLHNPDETLFSAFSLADETCNWLRKIQASSLAELAQQVVASW